MQIPNQLFGFQQKDLTSQKDFKIEDKIKCTEEISLSEMKVDLLSEEERQRVLCQYNGNGALFIKGYPKNVQEALLHE